MKIEKMIKIKVKKLSRFKFEAVFDEEIVLCVGEGRTRPEAIGSLLLASVEFYEFLEIVDENSSDSDKAT